MTAVLAWRFFVPVRDSPAELREQGTRNVDFTPADMGMQIDGARHHDVAGKIIHGGDAVPVRRRGDDVSVADIDVSDFTVYPVGGIVNSSVAQFDQHGGSSRD
jgi:hypothetical protein